MSSYFGALVDNNDVENAVTATITFWIDAYLAAKERAKGLSVPTFARPASYNETYDYDNWPEGQLPGIAVVCGDPDELIYHAGGVVGAWFAVNVDAIVTDQTEAFARKVAAAYANTLAALLTQQSALMGAGSEQFAVDVVFDGWELTLPDVSNRTLAVGQVQLRVLVDTIFDPTTAPLALPDPPESDPGDWPQADTTDLTLTTVPVDEPLTD